eukprot:gene10319-7214_t
MPQLRSLSPEPTRADGTALAGSSRSSSRDRIQPSMERLRCNQQRRRDGKTPLRVSVPRHGGLVFFEYSEERGASAAPQQRKQAGGLSSSQGSRNSKAGGGAPSQPPQGPQEHRCGEVHDYASEGDSSSQPRRAGSRKRGSLSPAKKKAKREEEAEPARDPNSKTTQGWSDTPHGGNLAHKVESALRKQPPPPKIQAKQPISNSPLLRSQHTIHFRKQTNKQTQPWPVLTRFFSLLFAPIRIRTSPTLHLSTIFDNVRTAGVGGIGCDQGAPVHKQRLIQDYIDHYFRVSNVKQTASAKGGRDIKGIPIYSTGRIQINNSEEQDYEMHKDSELHQHRLRWVETQSWWRDVGQPAHQRHEAAAWQWYVDKVLPDRRMRGEAGMSFFLFLRRRSDLLNHIYYTFLLSLYINSTIVFYIIA